MSALMLLALAGMGVVAGLLAGLLGVGGGLVLVPVLVWVMEGSGMHAHVQHMALGTSLAVMVFTSFSSVRAHHRHGAVDWAIVRRFAPAIVLGTLLGTQLAGLLPSRELRWFFIVYAYLIAAQMLLDAKPKASRTLPGAVGLGGVGLGIGVVSSFVGIGGGSMSVPFMSWCNIPLKRAIATSAALGWPIAFSGALGYMVSGWGRGDLPAYTVGFVYLPAVATLCLITMATAPMGARLAHRLPVAKLKKLFALLMVVMASQLLIKALA